MILKLDSDECSYVLGAHMSKCDSSHTKPKTKSSLWCWSRPYSLQ